MAKLLHFIQVRTRIIIKRKRNSKSKLEPFLLVVVLLLLFCFFSLALPSTVSILPEGSSSTITIMVITYCSPCQVVPPYLTQMLPLTAQRQNSSLLISSPPAWSMVKKRKKNRRISTEKCRILKHILNWSFSLWVSFGKSYTQTSSYIETIKSPWNVFYVS